MKGGVLVDTGPLVACFIRKDSFHAWSRAQLARIAPPLLTCEAVLAEACFLVRHCPGGSETILELLRREIVRVAFHIEDHADAVRKLMARYANVPMSLADACLVRMAELKPDATLLTLDSDFRIYRRHGRHALSLIMPGTVPQR